jgi:hypothetical protein
MVYHRRQPPTLGDIIDLARFELRELQPGEACVYFTGNLARARTRSIIRALANEVWERARAGEICLTQQRLRPSDFAYKATRRRHA